MAGFIIGAYMIGFVFCMFLDMLVIKLLGYIFGLEELAPFDLIFLQSEVPKNIQNYIGAVFYDKFDGDEWKRNLLAKLENIHRCKAKVVRKFGGYWFQKLTDREWEI